MGLRCNFDLAALAHGTTVAQALAPAVAHNAERDHYHCPAGCEHPQPFAAGELLLCGLCWHWRGRCSIMELCTAETCP